MGKFINVTVDTSGLERRIRSLTANSKKAVADAVTATGQYASGQVKAAIPKAFDRPTAYTQNAIFASRATTSNPESTVGVKNQTGGRLSPNHWLFAQVEGGARTQKAFERALTSMHFMPSGWAAVPTWSTPLDKYGNVSGGSIRSMLNQLQRQASPGSNVGPSATRQRKRASRSQQYFGVAVGDNAGRLRPGIYVKAGSGIHLVMGFIDHLPRYTKRLDFYSIGTKAAQERFPVEVRLAMRKAIDDAR